MSNIEAMDWDATGIAVVWSARRLFRCYRRLQLLNDDVTPINITLAGYAFTAKITANESSATALKTFTIINTEYSAGYVGFEIAAGTFDLASGVYWASGTIDRGSGPEPLFSGPLEVTP